MAEKPLWLPPPIVLDGEWEEILARLYYHFKRDFKDREVYFKGSRLLYNSYVVPGDKYEEGFWHLITEKDNRTGDRIPDFDRASCLSWCVPILENADDPNIKTWDYREASGRIRTYVWLVEYSYVMVLEKRNYRIGEVSFLITAFSVKWRSKRLELMKKYENRET